MEINKHAIAMGEHRDGDDGRRMNGSSPAATRDFVHRRFVVPPRLHSAEPFAQLELPRAENN